MEILNALMSALEYHQAGSINEAVQIYQQILLADPDNADALHLMGNAAGQMGDVDYSISLISRASALFPRNPLYLTSLGTAYRAKKLFDRATACYYRILEIEPNTASAHFGIGNTLQAAGRLAEAEASFGRALALNPNLVEARYNLANLQKSSGKYSDAVDNYQMAVNVKPDFADAFHNMGSALYTMGKLDEALASYQRALWCNLPETHNNIGTIFFDKGQFSKALTYYKQAIALKPDYIEAFNNMARTYFSMGVAKFGQHDLAAATDCFELSIACRPDDADTLYNLGLVNGSRGRLGEAECRYRQVLELDPDYVDAHINLSAILLEDGRTGEAKRHIDLAYSRKNLFEKRVPGADKTVLILFDAGKGNLNLTHLFSEKTSNIIDWMIEYADQDQVASLPHYDLVFNAMGDADMTGNTAAPVQRFLQVCSKPLLNHPDQVARTARDKLPALLEGIDHLLVPSVWRCADQADWAPAIMDRLPLLSRPVHTQGGIGLELATTAAQLAQRRAQQSGPLYVSTYVDFRSADSWFRKYRMIFIDRTPYPYHLAISQNWMVHYYTAEMEACPWKLEEEKHFLEDPEAVLGAAGMQALQAIGARLDLDYAGIDFSIMPDGRILVFEANPTMLVHPENSAVLEHRNIYVRRIFDAFEDLLKRSVG